MNPDQLPDKLKDKTKAYGQLLRGTEILLSQDSLFWTERRLLELVQAVAEKRLTALLSVLPDLDSEDDSKRLKEVMLETAVEAALDGHDLSQWEQVENGWQATCRLCQGTVWVGENGLKYSLLKENCSSTFAQNEQ